MEGVSGPISIAAGHVIWGVTLGLLYVRPVGYPSDKHPDLGSVRRHKSIRPTTGFDDPPAVGFMFATGVECSYPTLDRGRWRMDEMAACRHYRYWRKDLELVRQLGIRYLRYGPPLRLKPARPATTGPFSTRSPGRCGEWASFRSWIFAILACRTGSKISKSRDAACARRLCASFRSAL